MATIHPATSSSFNLLESLMLQSAGSGLVGHTIFSCLNFHEIVKVSKASKSLLACLAIETEWQGSIVSMRVSIGLAMHFMKFDLLFLFRRLDFIRIVPIVEKNYEAIKQETLDQIPSFYQSSPHSSLAKPYLFIKTQLEQDSDFMEILDILNREIRQGLDRRMGRRTASMPKLENVPAEIPSLEKSMATALFKLMVEPKITMQLSITPSEEIRRRVRSLASSRIQKSMSHIRFRARQALKEKEFIPLNAYFNSAKRFLVLEKVWSELLPSIQMKSL